MKKLFGTDGIRGIAGDFITPELGFKIGAALVQFRLRKELSSDIIIGQDPRGSSEELARAVIQGIEFMKGTAINAGVVPTPVLAFLAEKNNYGGIMITASHNPKEHNGFKVFPDKGIKTTEQEEEELESYIFSIDGKSFNKKNITKEKDFSRRGMRDYDSFLRGVFANEENFAKMNIVLDCANGATSEIAPVFFKSFCGRVDSISASPDGSNINVECGSEFPEKLSKKVIESQAHVGFAFDGDGDRLVVVDETGRVLKGDHLLYIFSLYLKDKNELNNDLVISTIMSNEGFVRTLNGMELKHKRTNVGDQQVFSGMKEYGASLGGEDSGHIIFSNYHVAGDGIFSALMLLKALDHLKRPLSELADDVPLMPRILTSTNVKEKIPLENIPELISLIKDQEKKLAENGRISVRYSGTEFKCRVMVEAFCENTAQEYAEELLDMINKHVN